MSETLGSLCDKLTIVKLKQFHTEDKNKLESLKKQEEQLSQEIDEYIANALSGKMPLERLTFESNKVYKKEGNELRNIKGSIGSVFAELAKINCDLWHEQDKVYHFEDVPIEEKDKVVKSLGILNLERNKCIDEINNLFKNLICQK